VVTNVPGPQFPLYMLGQQLEAMFPMVPLAVNQALGIAIMSYNGQLNFGLNADYDAVPDIEVLADELKASIEELAAAAGLSPGRPVKAAPRPPVAVVSPPQADGPESESDGQPAGSAATSSAPSAD
jgi:hypothetical protein